MHLRLYRQYDVDGVLLYIGRTASLITRLQCHEHSSSWYGRIAKITLENFNTREELLEAEKLAIENENPLFNVQFKRASQSE